MPGYGLDANTKLFCKMDGTTTSFVDSSPSAKSITANGNATQIAKKLKNTAMFFPGVASNCVTIASSTDFHPAGDFTVEMFVMFNTISLGSGQMLFSKSDASNGIRIRYANGSNITLYTNANSQTFNWTPTVYTWYHLMVVRTSGVIKVYIDGAQIGSNLNFATAIGASTNSCFIGQNFDASDPFSGWLKEVRFSTVARSAVVPTSEYSPDASTVLLLHGDTKAIQPLCPAINFNGSTGYLSAASSSDFDITADFTLEVWVNSSAWQESGFLTNANGSTGGWRLDYDTSAIIFGISSSDILYQAWSPTNNLWYHIAVSRSGNNFRLFLNGQQMGSTVVSSASIPTSAAVLKVGSGYRTGGGSWGAQNYFKGNLKSARITKGLARYTSTFTPPQAPLSADGNTSILILGNENNGATTFVDSNTSAKTLTTNGTVIINYLEDYRNTIFVDSETTPKYPYPSGLAKIDFVQPFGSGVGRFDGTSGTYISCADSADWNFGTNNMTLDLYFKANAVTSISQGYFSQGTDSTNYATLYWDQITGRFSFYVYISNSAQVSLLYTLSHLPNTWYHLAVSRSGNNWTMFLNGTIVAGPTTASFTYPDYTGVLAIGKLQAGSYDGGELFNGFIDNARLENGTALYTTTFNPPYSSGGASFKSMIL